jgi:hypothetical protein
MDNTIAVEPFRIKGENTSRITLKTTTKMAENPRENYRE